jgi:hypothetical protein
MVGSLPELSGGSSLELDQVTVEEGWKQLFSVNHYSNY